MLIVNADDWGRTLVDTDAALTCFTSGRVTSVTAMMHMADSVRAAALAMTHGVPVGLHINLTESYTAPLCSSRLRDDQDRLVSFFTSSRAAKWSFNPPIVAACARVFQSQCDEFLRLYGKMPTHYDGHEHIHLATNMMMSRVIPKGAKVRRNLSYRFRERSMANIAHRAVVDWALGLRHATTEYFFDLSQRMDSPGMERVCDLARRSAVELMCHPARPREQAYLLADEFRDRIHSIELTSYAHRLRP